MSYFRLVQRLLTPLEEVTSNHPMIAYLDLSEARVGRAALITAQCKFA